jgi:hypothetical protein
VPALAVPALAVPALARSVPGRPVPGRPVPDKPLLVGAVPTRTTTVLELRRITAMLLPARCEQPRRLGLCCRCGSGDGVRCLLCCTPASVP